MERRFHSSARFSLTLSFLLMGVAQQGHGASTLYWDPTGTLGSSGSGTGVWSTSSTTNWWISGPADSAWTDATGTDTAVFGGSAGTAVTVSGNNVANALIFNAAGYTISGGSITMAGTSPMITINQNATIGSVIAGTNGLTTAGLGTLTLIGANIYSGGTTISSGTLQVGNGGTTGSLGSGTITDNGALVYSFGSAGSVSLPTGASITGSGNLNVSAGSIALNGNITLGGTESFVQLGNPGSLYAGIQLAAASTTLTGAAITLSGDVGTEVANGNTLALTTTASNGPINLNISLGRSGVWFIPTSFTASSGTGLINVTGVGPSSSGWRSTPVTLTGDLNISGNVNSATLVTLNSTVNGSVSGQLSGAMSLVTGGSAVLNLSNSNTYTGGTTVSSGTLQLGNVLGLGPTSNSLAMAGGALDLNGYSIGVGALSGSGTIDNITAGGLATLAVGNASSTNTTFSGNLQNSSGTVALVKSGSGSLVLTGSNTYGGGTTIAGGLLAFANSSSLPATPSTNSVTIAGGALAITGPYSTVAGWFGSGLVAPNPTGGAIALAGADNETINLSSGSLASYANLSLGAVGNATYSGTLTPSGSNYNFGGGGGNLYFATAITGSSGVAMSQAGLVALTSVSNSYSGGTTISAGTLQVGDGLSSAGSLPGAIVDNSVLGFAIPSGNTYSATNSITGAGGLVKSGSGSLILVNPVAYAGVTTISAGSLQIGNGTSGEGLASSSITNNATLLFNNADSMTYAGAISGAGALVKLGSGSVTLVGSDSYSSGTTVNAGMLVFLSSGTLNTHANQVWNIASGAVAQTTGQLNLDVNQNGSSQSSNVIGAGTLLLASTVSSTTVPDLFFGPDHSGTAYYGAKVTVTTLNLGSVQRYFTSNSGHNSVANYPTQNDAAISSNIIGSGGITFTGNIYSGAADAELELTGSNSFLGPVQVNEGGVFLNNANALTKNNTVILANSGTASGNYSHFFLWGNNATISNLQSIGTAQQFTAVANGNPTMSAAVAAATLTINESANTTFSGVIQNTITDGYDKSGGSVPAALSLIKSGPAMLTLSLGSNYTGGTTLRSGTLNLGFNVAGAALTNILPSSGTVTLAGGTLLLTGSATGTNSQTVGNLTLNAGGSSIDLLPGASNTLSLTSTSGFTRSIGATINLIPGTATLNLGSMANTTGIIGAYATINGTDWAALSSSLATAYTGYNNNNATTLPTSGNGSSYNFSQTNSFTLTNNLSVNTLKVSATGAAGTFTIPSGNILTLTGSGLLFTGTNAYTFMGGSLTAGAGAAASDLIVQQYSSAALTMSSAISNNGAFAVNLVMAGTGTMVLATTNSYTGSTYLNGGALQFGNSAELGAAASPLIFGGGTIRYSGNTDDLSLEKTMTFNAGGATFDTNGQNVTFSTAVGNGGFGGLTKAGAGLLTLSATNNAFSGPLTVNGGSVSVAALGNMGAASPMGSGANVNFGGGTLVYSGTGAATDRTFTFSTGGGTINIPNASATVTLNGATSGAGGLTLAGAGLLAFANAPGYSGATTVSSGTLQLPGLTVPTNGGNPVTTMVATGAALVMTGPLNLQGTVSADRLVNQVAGGGTLQFASNSSLASPDIYANTYVSGGYGISTNVNINLGNNTTRWITGQAYGNDYGEYGSGDLGLFGSLSGTNVNVTIQGTGTTVYSGAAFDVVLGGSNFGWSGPLTVVQGQVALASSNALSSANNVYLNTTGSNYAQLYLFGNNVSIGSLFGTGPGTMSIRNGSYAAGYGTHANATLTVNQTTNGTFAGSISDGPNDYEGGQSESTYYSLGITKSGTAVLTLTGLNNNYTGITTVSQGTLSFGYEATSGSLSTLGAIPSSITPNNIILNGGALSANASLTLNANRGIGLGPTSGVTGGSGTLNVVSGAIVQYSGAIASAGNTGANIFTQTGLGTLILAGNSSDTGVTNFSGGAAIVNGSLSSGTTNLNTGTLTVNGSLASTGLLNMATGTKLSGTGSVGFTTVAGGGTINVNANPDVSLTFASLTLGQNSGNSATFNLSGNNFNNPAVNVTGFNGLTTNGGSASVTLNIAGAAAVSGSYALIGFNGTIGGTGSSAFTLGTLPVLSSRQVGNLVDTGSQIDWVVTGSYPIWTGSNSNLWVGGTNWRLSGSSTPTDFVSQDTVVFDDTATGTTSIVIAGTGNVNPLSVTFNNNSLPYSISGSNGITGPAVLTLNGSAAVLINNSNSYTGGTTVNANGLLQIGNSAALGSGVLAINGGAVTSGGTAAYAISNQLLITNSATLGDPVNYGALTFTAAAGTLASSPTVTVNSPVSILGNLSGGLGVGLTVAGTSTLTLAGSNSYPGTTTISGATLQIGNGGSGASLGATSDVVDNGSLIFNTANSPSVGLVISGTGAVTQAGTGNLTLANASNSYTGPTIITSGTLTVATVANGLVNSPLGAATNNSGNLILNGGVLNYSGAATGTTDRGMTFGLSNGTINHASALTLNGVLAGSGGFTKTGTGVLTLNGSNSYAGGTNIAAGTVVINNGSAFGTGTVTISTTAGANPIFTINNTSAVTLANNIILPAPSTAQTYGVQKNSSGQQTGTTINFAGTISGGNANTTLFLNSNTSGDDSTTYEFSGTNSFTVALINLNRGGIIVTNSASLGSPSNIIYMDGNGGAVAASLGDLRFTAPMVLANPIQLASDASFGPSGNVVSLTGLISGSTSPFQLVGSGLLTLTNTNTYSDGTTVSGGTLSVSYIAASGTASNIGTGNITLDGGLLQYTGGAQTTNRTLTLTANGGEFDASGTGPINLSNAGAIGLTGTATHSLVLGGSNTGANTLSTSLNDFVTAVYPSSLTKTGSGTWILAGNSSTYTGGTNLSSGTLVVGVNNALSPASVLTFGSSTSGGTLDLNGNYQQIGGLAVAVGADPTQQAIINSNTASYAALNIGVVGSTNFGGSIRDSAAGQTGAISVELSSGVLTLTGSSNNWSGGTTVDFGATLSIASTGSLPRRRAATINGTLDLAGFNASIDTLNGSGVIDNLSATIGNTLTVGSANGTSEFDGVIQNTTGVLALVKNGTGSFTLTNANTYAGGTTLTSGTLILANGTNGSATGTGNVTLNGGALATSGTASLSGAVLAGSGSNYISVGGDGGIGSLTVGGLTLNNLSTLRFDATSPTNLDQILFANSGPLSFSGTGAANLYVTSGLASGSYPLMSGFNSPTAFIPTDLALSVIGGGVPPNYQLQIVGSQLDLVVGAAGPNIWSVGSGSWSTNSNWQSGSAPNAPGQTAYLTQATSAAISISLDSAQTLGTLAFANSASATTGYILTPGVSGSLTLDNSGSLSLVSVSSGSHQIAAPLIISGSDTSIAISGGGSLNISGNIADDGFSRALSLTSSDNTGVLTLSGTNTYGGQTTVNSGTLILNGASSLLAGNSLVIGSGSSPGAIFSSPSSFVTTSHLGGGELAPVPEPGTIGLLAVAAALGAWATRKNLSKSKGRRTASLHL